MHVTVATLACALLVGGSGMPLEAPADGPVILVSADGLEWTSDPTTGFPADFGMVVPGSAHQADIWLKNVSGRSALLQLGVVLTTASTASFDGHLSMSAWTDEVGPNPVVAHTNTCLPLLEGQQLAAGEQVRVTLDVALDEAATNTSQGASVRPTYYVTLVEQTSGAVPPVGCTVPSNRPNTIASTGSPTLLWLLGGGALALACVVSGTAVRAGARRS